MSTTIDYNAVAPEVVRPLFESGKLLADSGLEPALRLLVDLRASQINGCAFCLALHMHEAEAIGETRDRIATVPAWRESPWFSERERLALELTEALTHLAAAHPPGDLLDRLKAHFSEREIVYLVLNINTINAWNRWNVALGMPADRAEAVFKMMHSNGSPAHA